MTTEDEATGEGGEAEDEWTAFDVRKQALDLLAQRGHSRSELERKLADRDVPGELAEEVCDALVEEGRLDDMEFARHQGAILRDKQWGPRQIRRKLRDHGVDDGIVDLVLEKIGGRETWVQGCWRRLCDRFGDDPDSFDQETKEKAYRHLTHRGFQPSTVRQILFDGVRPSESPSEKAPHRR